MKITDLAILFILIILPFNLLLDIRTQYVETASYKKLEINRILDTAVEDGVTSMIEGGGGKKVRINSENGIKEFLNSLYVNFNVLPDSYKAMQLQGYLPCIAIVDYDGYYIVTNQEYDSSEGYKVMKLVCNAKQSYSWFDGVYVYIFTLDDTVTLVEPWTDGSMWTGTRDQVAEQLTDEGITVPEYLSDPDLFDRVRRKTIIESIKADVNYAVNRHNDIARQFGISYSFNLPQIPDADWYKTADDVGMLAFFQGMPIGLNGERINSYALGGARIVKSGKFVVDMVALPSGNFLKYYHRPGCTAITDDSRVLDSEEECAANGYMPCPVCKP